MNKAGWDLTAMENQRAIVSDEVTLRPVLDWRQNMARMLLASDLVVIAATVYVTQIVWLGFSAEFRGELPYWVISAAIVFGWTWSLSLNDSRSHRILGVGWTEYVRVISASARFFGLVAIVAFLMKADIARGFLLLTLPFGVGSLLLSRFVWRQWLISRRAKGIYSTRAVLVGASTSVTDLARELDRVTGVGFSVVGACLPTMDHAVLGRVPGGSIPVVGDFNTVIEGLESVRADTVVIASAEDLTPLQVKRISWALEAGRQHLVLAPGIMDIAGPRMHIRPVAGLPLIHVETPTFSKGQRFVKRSVDLVLSSLAIVVLSPLLLALALLVRLTSKGPALFFQERTGRGGSRFRMVKFRSMDIDAEQKLEELRSRQIGIGNEVLFKLRDDPRITPVGRFMRRYSLDELPQFFNVLVGTMSLIGPRPPLPAEVEKYDAHVHRRFLMKPGLTGPWQVGGRSKLSWEESVRLDLSYVENWSLANDLMILLKTVKVVVAPGDSAH